MTRRHGDDSGATLIIVLFIVTVVAVVVGALATSADTAERATVGLRVPAASTYTADGAGQIAVNTLRKGTWANATGSGCFGASSSLALNNVYPAVGGSAASSAYVSCAAEAGTGLQGSPVAVSSANKPGNAVLTLGTSISENGQFYGQSSEAITVHGGVISDSNIAVKSSASLAVTGGAALSAVTGCSGSVTPTCTALTAPGILDPNYPAPASSLVVSPASIPTCKNNTVAEFQPGLYTSAALLNNCDNTSALMHFNPGTYFFDFQDAGSNPHVWTTAKSVVVGGTPTAPLNGASPPAVPGACVNPIKSVAAVGVTFVFGGDSQLAFGKGANFEICASYSASTIPTVLYALKSTLTNPTNPAIVAHAESGCVIAVNGCDLISDGANGVKPSFFFEGFVYAPWASVNIAVNNASQPYFNFGVVLRRLTLTSTGSASGAAYISLPDNSPGYGTADTIADLTVYVCAGASSCSPSGRAKLRARVDINDPTGTPVAGARRITVLSWNLLP